MSRVRIDDRDGRESRGSACDVNAKALKWAEATREGIARRDPVVFFSHLFHSISFIFSAFQAFKVVLVFPACAPCDAALVLSEAIPNTFSSILDLEPGPQDARLVSKGLFRGRPASFLDPFSVLALSRQ